MVQRGAGDRTQDGRFVELTSRERAGVLRGEVARIAERLGRLDTSDLDRPARGDWSVREVVAHLAAVPTFYRSSVERGRGGKHEGPAGGLAAGEGRGTIVAGGVQQQAAEVARTAGDAVIEQFVAAGSALADALDGDDDDLAYPCYHPGGIVPANRFAVLFGKELGLHEWDVFDALESPGAMGRWGTDAALAAMEEEIASGSLRWVTDSSADPTTAVIEVSLRGHLQGRWHLLLESDTVLLVPPIPDRRVDGRFDADAGEFVLCCSGRLDPLTLLADGRASGDAEPLGVLARRLSGM